MSHQSLSPWRLAARMMVVLVALCGSLGSAQAGLFDDEEARKAILDLRQKLQESQQKIDDVSRRAADDRSQLQRGLLDLQNQLDATRAELAKMRGQEEQMVRELSEVQRQQKDASLVLEERLRKFEPSRVSVDGKEFMAEPAEKRDFDAAMAVFRKGDFAASQLVFVDFLNRYAKTGYRQSALFWLGNAQYATREYKEGLGEFSRASIAHDADAYALPEAVLAIATSQTRTQGQLKAARKTLEELLVNYPSSEAAQAAKDRLARLR
jgi:TolA-binding protein